MWIRIFLFFLLYLSIPSCREKSTDFNIEEITLSDTVYEEDPTPPPPPRRYYHFDNLNDWFSYLCDSIRPTGRVVSYYFTIDKYNNNYSILFTGNSKYDPDNKEWVYSVVDDVQDSNLLPQEYQKLTDEEVLKKVAGELRAFTHTEQFKRSYFAKAKAIATGFFQQGIVMIK